MTARRCPQCYRDKTVAAFVPSLGERPRRQCNACRARYSGWERKTLEQKVASIPPRRDAPATGRIVWSARSRNHKLGGIPCSMSERATCPPSCGMYEAGCYASYGKLGAHWRGVGERGLPWEDFLERVRALPEGTLWRHNVAGDLRGDGVTIDLFALSDLVQANRGRRGFTYTHYSSFMPGGFTYTHYSSFMPGSLAISVLRNESGIRWANRNGFAINVSCDTLEEADTCRSFCEVPVVVLVPQFANRSLLTPRGHRVVICPAQLDSEVTCASCGLCAQSDRSSIIGFRAHGQFKKILPELVQLRRKSFQTSEVAAE